MNDIRSRAPHAVIGVAGDSPFAYSVGLWNHNFPELIVSGMPGPHAMMTINQVAAMMLSTDHIPADGEEDNDLFTMKTRFRRVSDAVIDERMSQTVEAERAVSDHPYALQIVWPDPYGVFPDEPGYTGNQIIF
jgi:hypothetical protein